MCIGTDRVITLGEVQEKIRALRCSGECVCHPNGNSHSHTHTDECPDEALPFVPPSSRQNDKIGPPPPTRTDAVTRRTEVQPAERNPTTLSKIRIAPSTINDS